MQKMVKNKEKWGPFLLCGFCCGLFCVKQIWDDGKGLLLSFSMLCRG